MFHLFYRCKNKIFEISTNGNERTCNARTTRPSNNSRSSYAINNLSSENNARAAPGASRQRSSRNNSVTSNRSFTSPSNQNVNSRFTQKVDPLRKPAPTDTLLNGLKRENVGGTAEDCGKRENVPETEKSAQRKVSVLSVVLRQNPTCQKT